MLTKLLALTAALALTACGVDTSKLAAQDQPSTGSASGSASAERTPAPAAQPATTVRVHTETDVEVTVGGQTVPQVGQSGAVPVPAAGTLLQFVGGAFGWFFADGSFDRGAVYVHGQQAAGYCRFEAPSCEGRCVVDALPVKDSLFTDGTTYYQAIETETDLGRAVVASVWRNGACQAEVKTIQHSYKPAHAWALDAGDSTVPSVHAQ